MSINAHERGFMTIRFFRFNGSQNPEVILNE